MPNTHQTGSLPLQPLDLMITTFPSTACTIGITAGIDSMVPQLVNIRIGVTYIQKHIKSTELDSGKT